MGYVTIHAGAFICAALMAAKRESFALADVFGIQMCLVATQPSNLMLGESHFRNEVIAEEDCRETQVVLLVAAVFFTLSRNGKKVGNVKFFA